MARNLFAKLSLEDTTPSVNVNVEITPEDVVEATSAADELNEAEQVVTEALVTLEEAEEALGELQEADNAAAAALGEEQTDIVTGEPVAVEAPVEGDAVPAEPVETAADENTVDPVEVPVENQEVAAAVVQEALRHCYKKLGIDFKKVKVSYESIASQPRAALRLAREEAQEAAKSMWKKILEFIKNIPSIIANMFGKLKDFIVKSEETLKRLREQLKDKKFSANGNLPENIVKSFNENELNTALKLLGVKGNYANQVQALETIILTGVSNVDKWSKVKTLDDLVKINTETAETYQKVADANGAGDFDPSTLSSDDCIKAIDKTLNISGMGANLKPKYDAAAKHLENLAKAFEKAGQKDDSKILMDFAKSVTNAAKHNASVVSFAIKMTAKVVAASIKASNNSKEDAAPKDAE